MYGLYPPPLPQRSTGPRFPSLKTTLLVGLMFAGLMALLPQAGISAPASAARGLAGDLGAPVASLFSRQQARWQDAAATYVPLTRRSAELNAMLSQAVDVLTQGSAVASRDRLLALQASLRSGLNDVRRLRTEAAITPAVPCATSAGMLTDITCRFETTRAERLNILHDAEGTVAQRLAQIAAERDRFATDLKTIGIDVSPAQVDGLLKLATAGDLVNLHAAYNNLKDMTGQLRSAMLATAHDPATAQRYYGIYVVMLEVALHMHEEFFLKLHDTYLPRLETLTQAADSTYQRAAALAATTQRPDLRQQLRNNMSALDHTRRAARLYRSALLSQAAAVNESWQRLYEQHEVAVNSYRTVTLSSALLQQMQASGKGFDTLRRLEVPALENLGNAALQQEFDRLSRALTQPDS